MNRYYEILKTRFSYKLNGRILARIGTIPKAISNIRLCNFDERHIALFCYARKIRCWHKFPPEFAKSIRFCRSFFSQTNNTTSVNKSKPQIFMK